MAVYSSVSEQQMQVFLAGFPVGRLLEFSGVDSGIENTNYFVNTEGGQFVLTLFERLSAGQLPYYLDLMCHLGNQSIACPIPVASNSGDTLSMLNGKPAAIVTRLPGEAQMMPTAAHCASLGATLARMHVAARTFEPVQPNLRGLAWCGKPYRASHSKLPAGHEPCWKTS